MWILFAFGSAFFAGVTAVLAKCGIQKTDSTVATAIRTIVVLVFSWLMVFLVGSQTQIASISGGTWLFLVLSGLSTGASWLCYFKALQLGEINKVVPVDKSSVVLTMLLAFIFLHERISLFGGIGIVLIAVGTFLMIEKKDVKKTPDTPKKRWLLYAVGSAVFASLTSILGKVGISGVESNLGRGARHGLGDGPDRRQAAHRAADPEAGASVHLPVRHRDRRLVAVLLPGAAGRPRQRGRPHRQAEHPRDGRVFLLRLSRAAFKKVRRRPRARCGRHAGHAVLTPASCFACCAGAGRSGRPVRTETRPKHERLFPGRNA